MRNLTGFVDDIGSNVCGGLGNPLCIPHLLFKERDESQYIFLKGI